MVKKAGLFASSLEPLSRTLIRQVSIRVDIGPQSFRNQLYTAFGRHRQHQRHVSSLQSFAKRKGVSLDDLARQRNP